MGEKKLFKNQNKRKKSGGFKNFFKEKKVN